MPWSRPELLKKGTTYAVPTAAGVYLRINQAREALQNSGEAVVVRMGMGYTALS